MSADDFARMPDHMTDAEVEAAAQALADRPGITYGVHPDLMRVVARAALSAARAARRDEETTR